MSDLEALLRDTAREVDWPSADISPRTMAAIDRPYRSRWSLPRWVAAIATVMAVLLGMLVTPVGREAVANVLDLVGIRVTWGTRAGIQSTGLEVGDPVSMSEARGLITFDLLIPEVPPDSINYSNGSIHMIWESDSGEVERIYSQLPGSEVFAKVLEPETGVRFVRLRETEGFWIDGAPHLLQVIGPDGELREEQTRLAANVLAWDEEGVTHRVETTSSLEEALEFAGMLGK